MNRLSIAVLSLVFALPTAAEVEYRFGLDAGYRVGELEWSIAGDSTGNNPNVLSELTWTDLRIFQVKGDGRFFFPHRLGLVGTLTLGSILGGEARDSDYAGDDRTQEYSRSSSTTEDAYVLDGSLAVLYQFLDPERFAGTRLSARLGYQISKQSLRMTDGIQTVSQTPPPGFGQPPPLGPFPGLDSRYETEWNGPWLGLELDRAISGKSSLIVDGRVHLADYYAEADWNLRSDFEHPKSFEHVADGLGLVLSVAWRRLVGDRVPLYIRLDLERWETDSGIDRIFLSDGTRPVTRLNEALWRSTTLSVGGFF